MRRTFWLSVSLLASLGACTRPPSPYPQYGSQPPAAAPGVAPAPAPSPSASAPAPSGPRSKLAVVPFVDSELFRSERAQLRRELAHALAARLPQHELLSLDVVDAELRPVSKSGKLCAYPYTPVAERANRKGWLTTKMLRVFRGPIGGGNRELWVELRSRHRPESVLVAAWNEQLPLVERYRHAFSSLKLDLHAGALGGLQGNFVRPGLLQQGSVSLCEAGPKFSCLPSTQAFADQVTQIASCYRGVDEASDEVLFEPGASCELVAEHDAASALRQREQCLCSALRASAGMRAATGRRSLSIDHLAKGLEGRPRPELRVTEVSTNLPARADWHSRTQERGGKRHYVSLQRLTVENLDALAPALSRCAKKPGASVGAELILDESGHVTSVQVLHADAPSACVERALKEAVFECTRDGKAGRIRLEASWPTDG